MESVPSSGTAQLQVVDDLEGLERLTEGWECLESGVTSPMQHFIWARAYAGAFPDARLRLLVVGPTERPRAIAPLVERAAPFHVLEMLGVRQLHEPMDFIYADRRAFGSLARAMLELGAPLHLSRVPADSPASATLRRACKGHGWLRAVPDEGCPSLALGPGWKEPESQFNARRRSDFRRAQRHADKIGKVSYQIIAPRPGELEPLLDEAYAVEAEGWKGAAGSALTVDRERGAFFRTYARAASRKGILRLARMRIGEETAAVQLAVEWGRRFWLMKIGYREKFSHCSPGNLLMLETVRHAARRGLSSCEFLGRVENWTRLWTQSARPCQSLKVYPYNRLGITTLSVDAARGAWSRVKRERAQAAGVDLIFNPRFTRRLAACCSPRMRSPHSQSS